MKKEITEKVLEENRKMCFYWYEQGCKQRCKKTLKEFSDRLKEEFKLYRTDKFGKLFLTSRDRWFMKRIDEIKKEMEEE